MTEIQRVGLILLIAGIVIIAVFIADKRECERRKAANREQLREIRRRRRSFIRNMRDNEIKDKPAKGETTFHSQDCAAFRGGKYVPKGEALCIK